MPLPLITEIVDGVGTGIEKKITREIVNWIWALLVLPVAQWIRQLFNRQQRRVVQRRNLESLKLSFDLEQTFGEMPPEHQRLYRDRYRELLLKSDEVLEAMPPELSKDIVDRELSRHPPVAPENTLTFMQKVYALSAPGLYVIMALVSTDESWELRAMMLLTGVLGAGVSLLVAWIFFAANEEGGFWAALKEIGSSLACYFGTLFLCMLVVSALGFEVPEFEGDWSDAEPSAVTATE